MVLIAADWEPAPHWPTRMHNQCLEHAFA